MAGLRLVPGITAAILLAFSYLSMAQSHEVEGVDELSDARIKTSFANSDYSFHGRVKSIDYRLSTPGPGGSTQPFTFVTYEIIDPLSDQIDATREVVIKFLGGALGAKFVKISHAPLFNVGDEDIVFVKGNGRTAVPVLQTNRFRVFEQDIYSDEGYLLGTDETNRNFRRLAIHNASYFTERKIGPQASLRRVMSSEEKKNFPILEDGVIGRRFKDELIQKLLKQKVKLLKRDALKTIIRAWGKERNRAASGFAVSTPIEQNLQPFPMNPVKAISAEDESL